jgi:hypothetical protein
MKLQTKLLTAALAATAVGTAIAATPAQAASINGGSRLNLSNVAGGGVSFFQAPPGALDFEGPGGGQRVAVGASTGSFSGATPPELPPFPRIQDITFTSVVGNIYTFTGNLTNFISGIDVPGSIAGNAATQARFDLTRFVFNRASGDATFFGNFRIGNTFSIGGSGLFTSQTNLGNPSTYSLSITAVPTPALLPGLIGLGFGVLRKRKSAATQKVGAEA